MEIKIQQWIKHFSYLNVKGDIYMNSNLKIASWHFKIQWCNGNLPFDQIIKFPINHLLSVSNYPFIQTAMVKKKKVSLTLQCFVIPHNLIQLRATQMI